MPWTFSHPAVVFPLKQSRIGRWLNLPALILGSLSPDLLYSFGMYRAADHAHHFGGWFYTALPVCLIILFIFHRLAAPLKEILPFPITDKLNGSLYNNTILLISLFIGAATHIIWDSFTHETGAVVRAWSILQFPLFPNMTNTQEIAIYKVLQHLGSLLGIGYLCIKFTQYQRSLPSQTQKENRHRALRFLFIVFLAALCTLPFAYQLALTTAGLHIPRFIFYQLSLCVTFMAGFIILAAITIMIKSR